MSRNVYVRLNPHEPRVFGSADTADSLIFIDVGRGGRLNDVRWVPTDKFREVSRVLVRSDEVTLEEAEILSQALGWNRAAVGHLRQAAGQQPSVDSAADDWDSSLLERARAIELRALLDWGDAVWDPHDYHYLLPSGRHISSFVRIGDVFHEPRDAEALASWFAPDLSSNLGIVIDSGTLTPLVTAIENWLLRAGLELGPVVVLDNYPRTELDARTAVRHANKDGSVLAIVSVSSSGRLRDRLVRALETQPLESGKLHVLVDSATPALSVPEIETWLPHDQLGSPAKRSVEPSACEVCRDPARKLLVPVSARSFQGMLPGQVRRLMPDTKAALPNREFWQLCDRAGAIGVHEPPLEAVRLFRGPGLLMGVKIRVEKLVKSRDFAAAVGARINPEGTPPDLVLVPAVEAKFDGYAEFYDVLIEATSLPPFTAFPIDAEWPAELRASVCAAKSILVLALGAVTGSSLQRALVAVQTIRGDADLPEYELSARVVSARPALKREWETLVNSYGRDPVGLVPVWLTYLPDRSPLNDEQRVLTNLALPPGSSEANEEFVKRRLQLCSGQLDVETEPLFWGSTLEDRITPHSIFGEGVTAPTVYAAVGSALETRRLSEEQAQLPELRQFEMRAIIRSYYDPLILAAVLRWLLPGEADWGDEFGYGGAAVAGEIVGRAKLVEPDHLRILLPELLLAVALGKFDARGSELIVSEARVWLESLGDPSHRAPIIVGLAAAEGGFDYQHD